MPERKKPAKRKPKRVVLERSVRVETNEVYNMDWIPAIEGTYVPRRLRGKRIRIVAEVLE